MATHTVPKILECIHYTLKSSCKNSRYVKDYEFDFYLSGERDMYIDGNYHRISAGTLVFRKPGQFVESLGDYDVYTLTIDFSNKVTIPQNKYMRQNNPIEQELCHHKIFDMVPETFFPYHQNEIKSLMKEMTLCSYPNIINEEMQNKLLTEFLLLVLSDSYKYARENKKSKENYVEKACQYINKNYDKAITVEKIAEYLSLNKNYLIRIFKKELNITPNHFVLKTRLFYAKLMLLQTDLTIKDIALSCGFNTPSYFIKCFKENFKKSPAVYKKEFEKKTQIKHT